MVVEILLLLLKSIGSRFSVEQINFRLLEKLKENFSIVEFASK